MQVKEYFKGVASAVLGPAVKALSNAFPGYGPGFTMILGNKFALTGLENKRAYNNKAFYAAANIFVRKIVESPVIFSEKKPKGRAKFTNKYYSKAISNEERSFIKSQGLDELDTHPLKTLFENPNNNQVGIELMEDFWYNYGHGDGFLYFEGLDSELSRDTAPRKIYSLNRDRVEIIESTDNFDRISYFNFTCWNGNVVRIAKENVLHLKHWNPNVGALKGLGVDVVAQMDITLNESNNKAQAAAFQNGGRGTLFSSKVEVTGEGKRVGKMSEPEMKMLQETIERDMQGAENNRRMRYTNGEVVITPYGDTLAEMELVKSEENNWKSVFAIWGIPWSLAPITQAATENNMAAGYKSLVTNLIIPEIRKFDQKLNQITRQWWPTIICCHDLTEFTELAPDLKLMMEVYGKPDLRVDERRSIFGYDEIGGDIGQAILVPSGLIKIEDIVNNEFEEMPEDQPEQL